VAVKEVSQLGLLLGQEEVVVALALVIPELHRAVLEFQEKEVMVVVE
jgi:hypothetical protein